MNKSLKLDRLLSLDIWRGIAILVMIFANTSAYILSKPHYTLLRFIFSFAAPIFIFISGYSYNISISKKNKKFKYQSGLYIIISAAIIDLLIYRIFPFFTFDVLYLIGIGIIMNTAISGLKLKWKLFISLFIFSLYFYLKTMTNYRFDIIEIDLLKINKDSIKLIIQENPIKRLLIDGWFPLFPWLGLAVLGGVVSEYRVTLSNNYKKYYLIGWAIFIIGAILEITDPIIQEERNNFLELFYPLYFHFILIIIGTITLIGVNISLNKFSDNSYNRFLSQLGRKSLLIYILHSFIIHYLLEDNVSELNLFEFLLIDLFFVMICYITAKFIEEKQNHTLISHLPIYIKKIFGL